VTERYPREDAERLRAAQRGGAELELARASAELERARAELARTDAALAAELAAHPPAPADALGPTSALELQRTAAFARRHADKVRALREELSRAQQRVARQEATLASAQAALSLARAGERVIERDRARFEGEQRRARQQAEQLDVEEHIDRSRNDRGDRPSG
jgi:hypothetical protein